MDAATFVGNEVFDFLFHVRSIEPGSGHVHHSICTQVTYLDVELLVNQLLKTWWVIPAAIDS